MQKLMIWAIRLVPINPKGFGNVFSRLRQIAAYICEHDKMIHKSTF